MTKEPRSHSLSIPSILVHVVLAVLFFLCCSPTRLHAQVLGSITGTVRDASGAVVPKARVVVSNPDKGLHDATVTNSVGDYVVTGLAEGHYIVNVQAPGFQKFEARNVVLRVGQSVRQDADLTVGQASSEVVVEGSSAGKVETQSSELSTTITSKQISQLELNGRAFTQLVTLSPGVSNQTGQDEGTVGPAGSVSYAINGGRTEFNNWEIDGGDVLDSGSMANINIYPNIDALDQVQVLTSSYDAQYGRSGSGAIEAVTKSGTNKFHGEAFEFLRNQFFNAKNYFNTTGPIGAYKKHDFGYTLGGPIKRDKLFFFWSEEFRRENVPGFYHQRMPTTAERSGDFSIDCPAPGTPFVRTQTPGYSRTYADCPAYAPDAAGDGGFLGFPNNSIASYIDHANTDPLLALTPVPNVPGSNREFELPAPAPMTWHEELFKIDYNLRPNLHAYFRFIHDTWKQTLQESSFWSNSNIPGIPSQEIGPGVSLVANLTWTISPTMSNEFLFGYGANHLSITNTTSAAARPSGMTMTGLFNNGFGGKVPEFNVNGGENYDGFYQDPGPLPFYNSNPTYTYKDNLIKLLGKHNLKTGFYFTANQKNEDAEVWTQGILGFSANGNFAFTSGPSTGNSFADMLVGDIASFSQASAEPKYYFRFRIFEPYIQDDWHVRKNLTLNLGLRISGFGLYKERYGQAYNFDPAKYSAANMPSVSPDDGSLVFAPGQSISNLSGIVRCGYNGIPPGCMTGHVFNPAPRVGFAYDPFGDGKTAIHAAYGIFFEHTNGNDANAESTEDQPPLVLQPVQFYPAGYTHIGGGEYFPLFIQSIPTKVTWPYVQQWHVDIQREVARNTMMTFAYVGSKGTHLTLQNDINQLHDLPPAQNPFPAGQPLTDSICNNQAFDNGTPITGDALFHLNIACGNVVSPDLYRQNFPGWDTIEYIGFGANSNYNALQISGRRTAGDLELTGAYTYSHSIDDSSDRYDSNFVDSYNIKASRASSNFDQRHIFNFTYIYNLPFFSKSKGLTKSLVGGWQWSGITEIQSGEPTSIYNGGFYDNAGVANGVGAGSYADIAPGVSKHHVPSQKYASSILGPLLYNPAAYIEPRGLTFGNSGRNSLGGPRTTNFDMGLFKNFGFGESRNLEFRSEAFNVFNHTQWNGVNNSPGCYLPNGNQQYSSGNSDCVYGSADGSITPQSFLHPSGAHNPRILQFALKFMF